MQQVKSNKESQRGCSIGHFEGQASGDERHLLQGKIFEVYIHLIGEVCKEYILLGCV